jgi:prolyl-tRNA editing enzyme YbaK/EbsC (Cys-tRNA(Pro) deacylase)
MITRLPPIARQMRIPFLGRLISSSQSLISSSRRAFLSRSTTAADDIVVLDSTHIDEYIKTRGIVTLPRENEAVAGAVAEDTLLSSHDACPLKCLLFLASGSPILIVLRLEDRVSEQALAAFLNVAKSRIEMAKPRQLVPLTGFPVGQVPPFGHRQPLYTLVDQCVTAHSHVVFGDNLEYVLPTTELLRAANGKVTSVSLAAVAAAAAAAVEKEQGERKTLINGSLPALTKNTSFASDLPLPWVEGAQAVSLTGIIAQKRKIANLLLFLNIVPASPGGQRVKVREEKKENF